MPFLLIQIFFLLLLAALCGALLTYWWMNNRFEDVTESHAELIDQNRRLADVTGGLSRKDLDESLAGLNAKIEGMRPSSMDPVMSRLTSVERALTAVRIPPPDFSAMERRFDLIEGHLTRPGGDIDGLHTRLAGIEGELADMRRAMVGVSGVDLSPLNSKLGQLEDFVRVSQANLVQTIQKQDPEKGDENTLAEVHNRLAMIELTLESLEFPSPNFEPVHTQLSALESKLTELGNRIDGARRADFDALSARLTGLSDAISRLGPPDMSHLHQRFANIDAALASLSMPEPNLRPIQERLDILQAEMLSPRGELQSLQPKLQVLETSLNGLGERMAALQNADLSKVEARLSDIETSILSLADADDGDVDARLKEIERVVVGLRNTDLTPVEAEMSRVSAALNGLRDVDLRPVEEQLVQIGNMVANIRNIDVRPLEDQLVQVQRMIASIETGQVDLGPLEARLRNDLEMVTRAVSAIRMPDLDGLGLRLTSIERAMADISTIEPDLRPIHTMMRGLERAIESLDRDNMDMSPVNMRLSDMEAALRDLSQRREDINLSPVLNAVYAMDDRMDLEALENRLTSIEYGLAAVHHMLRSRAEAGLTRFEPLPRPPQRRKDTAFSNEPIRTTREPVAPSQEPRGANLLNEPVYGAGDDLEQIDGVGPMLSALLNDIGVYYFWQVAEWTNEDVEAVDSLLLHFRGRIERDHWVEQARKLMYQPGAAKRP